MGMIGFVGYTDTPGIFFRIVYPNYAKGDTDAVLDDPKWITLGVNPGRTATMTKATVGPTALTSSPNLPQLYADLTGIA